MWIWLMCTEIQLTCIRNNHNELLVFIEWIHPLDTFYIMIVVLRRRMVLIVSLRFAYLVGGGHHPCNNKQVEEKATLHLPNYLELCDASRSTSVNHTNCCSTRHNKKQDRCFWVLVVIIRLENLHLRKLIKHFWKWVFIVFGTNFLFIVISNKQ